MKLKNKLYLTQFFIILTIFVFIGTIYTTFKKYYEDDLNRSLKRNTEVTTFLLHSALEDTYKTLEQKKEFIKNIHHTAIDTFKKERGISLYDLKNKMISLFHLHDLDLDFYLINKNYVITDATYTKDIGLDFKKIPPATKDLDQASKDGEIHIAKHLAIDYMDSVLKLYSTAKVDSETFLELALIDPFSFQKLRTRILEISKSTESKITLFRITKTSSNQEYYEDIMNTQEIDNKEKWKSKLQKFPFDTSQGDEIITAKRQNTVIKSDENINKGVVTMYIPFLSKKNDPSLGYNNFVMKLEMDVSKYLTHQSRYQHIFMTLILILIIFMFILYFFIKNHFYIPITMITKKFEDEVIIDDPNLLNKKDEFGILVENYNTLYTTLQNQIEKNKYLLDENRQFIADMVHQIRTPLTVIMTNASLIEMQTQDQVSSYIKQINSAINMLSNSYEDLAYGITNDTIEYKPSEIDISKLLHERIGFFEVIADANDKTIVTDIAMDIHLYMNDIELERLIDNNLSNAIKHSHDKSKIKIILEKINSKVLLQFISEGKHIYDVSKIFDKNYTESYGAKRSLGLGLNMVKTICEKNNIYYAVNSINHMNTFTYIFKS